MIWAKTEAGRAEMKARSLVHDRAQRNLLLLIDGKRPVEALLAGLAGVTEADLTRLHELGLIEPVGGLPQPEPQPAPSVPGGDVDAFDYATLRAAIGRMISQDRKSTRLNSSH